jgi:hypothetical protein
MIDFGSALMAFAVLWLAYLLHSAPRIGRYAQAMMDLIDRDFDAYMANKEFLNREWNWYIYVPWRKMPKILEKPEKKT